MRIPKLAAAQGSGVVLTLIEVFTDLRPDILCLITADEDSSLKQMVCYVSLMVCLQLGTASSLCSVNWY